MANIAIQPFNGNPAGSASPESEALAEQIRRLAFFLFERRGGGEGHAVEDGLNAERELVRTPAPEWIAKDGNYQLRVAAPGFDAQDVRVTAWPTSLLLKVRAAHHPAQADGEVLCCDFEPKMLCRRLECPESMDAVRAKLVNGILQVTAARGNRAEEPGLH